MQKKVRSLQISYLRIQIYRAQAYQQSNELRRHPHYWSTGGEDEELEDQRLRRIVGFMVRFTNFGGHSTLPSVMLYGRHRTRPYLETSHVPRPAPPSSDVRWAFAWPAPSPTLVTAMEVLNEKGTRKKGSQSRNCHFDVTTYDWRERIRTSGSNVFPCALHTLLHQHDMTSRFGMTEASVEEIITSKGGKPAWAEALGILRSHLDWKRLEQLASLRMSMTPSLEERKLEAPNQQAALRISEWAFEQIHSNCSHQEFLAESSFAIFSACLPNFLGREGGSTNQRSSRCRIFAAWIFTRLITEGRLAYRNRMDFLLLRLAEAKRFDIIMESDEYRPTRLAGECQRGLKLLVKESWVAGRLDLIERFRRLVACDLMYYRCLYPSIPLKRANCGRQVQGGRYLKQCWKRVAFRIWDRLITRHRRRCLHRIDLQLLRKRFSDWRGWCHRDHHNLQWILLPPVFHLWTQALELSRRTRSRVPSPENQSSGPPHEEGPHKRKFLPSPQTDSAAAPPILANLLSPLEPHIFGSPLDGAIAVDIHLIGENISPLRRGRGPGQGRPIQTPRHPTLVGHPLPPST